MGDNEAGAVQHERADAREPFDEDPFGELVPSPDDEDYRRRRAGYLAHRREVVEDERARLRERPALDLAPVSEVLRARWREAFRRELLELTAANVSEEMARSLACAQADAQIPKLVRRLAAEVWCGLVSGFVHEGAAAMAISVRDDTYHIVSPGEFRAVDPVQDALLFEVLAFARASGPAVLAEQVLTHRTAPDTRGRRDTFLGGFSDKLHIRADWPGEEPAQRSAWPWGEYSTPDMELVAEAVRAFWIEWDGEAATAPKNDTVIAWLEARGMSHNRAQAVAAVIRSPKVPAGARPRRDG